MATQATSPLATPATTIAKNVAEKGMDAVRGKRAGKPDKNVNQQPNRPTDALNNSSDAADVKNDPYSPGSRVSRERLLTAKDFFWDDWLYYIISGILALALIDISVEFLTDNRLAVLCFPPFSTTNGSLSMRDYSTDQTAFVNSWCSRLLPYTEYFPLFTLVQGIMLFIPHYIWTSVFASYFDFFFALAGTLERLREKKTGEYHPRNSAIVCRLEEEFANRRTVLLGYLFKQVAQGVLLFVFVIITFTAFKDFRTDITCPPEKEAPSLIFGRVECVYARFRFLFVLQIANVVLLILGLLIVIFSFVIVFVRTHDDILGFEKVAAFSYRSALHSSYFIRRKKDYFFSSFHLKSDLDFLMARLFSTDAGYGKIFKAVQVCNEVGKLLEADYQYLHTHVSMRVTRQERRDDEQAGHEVHGSLVPHSSVEQEPEHGTFITGPTMEAFIGHMCQTVASKTTSRHSEGRPRRAAVDISFVPHKFAFTIARFFERVLAIHLDENFQNPTANIKYEKFSQANLYNMQVPTNILAQPTETVNEFQTTIGHKFLDWTRGMSGTRYKVHFVIVSGVDSQAKAATVSQLIEMLSVGDDENRRLASGALLLILTPLSIEEKSVRGFQSLKLLSKYYWDQGIQGTLEDEMSARFRVRRSSLASTERGGAVSLSCGETQCTFQFSAYKYVPEGISQSSDYQEPQRTENWPIPNPFYLCCTSPNNETVS